MPGQTTIPNVLLCDDDELLISFYQRVLKIEGCNALIAFNGDDAIEALDSGQPIALAIIDLLMPVRSGWEVIEYMKRKPQLSDIPIIAMTGLAATPHDLHRVKELCEEVIFKGADFNIEEFSAMLKRILAKG